MRLRLDKIYIRVTRSTKLDAKSYKLRARDVFVTCGIARAAVSRAAKKKSTGHSSLFQHLNIGVSRSESVSRRGGNDSKMAEKPKQPDRITGRARGGIRVKKREKKIPRISHGRRILA